MMRVSRNGADQFDLELSRDELRAISNCMNEALHGLYIEEFSTRVGADQKTVESIHDQILRELRSKS
jgi:transcriptional regulator of heat shock response